MCTRLSLAVVSLGLFLSGHSGPGSANEGLPPVDRWIIDTDMAYDDQLAIMIALRHPRAEVLAISVSGTGTAHCPEAAVNAARLVDLAGGDPVPVACGPDFPLNGYHALPTPWREAADALAPVVARVPGDTRAATGAVDLIIDTLRSTDRPISILALAPHTNLALAFERAPDITGKVREIVAMGGTIHAPGNVSVPGVTDDLLNRTAEWNVFIDPVAAGLVLNTGVPIRLITLDTTAQVHVESTFVDQFDNLAMDSQVSRWTAAILKQHLDDPGGLSLWDAIAGVIAIDRGFCRYDMVPIRILTRQATMGWSYGDTAELFPSFNWRGEPRSALDSTTAGTLAIDHEGGRWITYCADPNAIAFRARFLELLANRPEPALP